MKGHPDREAASEWRELRFVPSADLGLTSALRNRVAARGLRPHHALRVPRSSISALSAFMPNFFHRSPCR